MLARLAGQGSYKLRNIRLDATLTGIASSAADGDDFLLCDLAIEAGRILAATPAGINADDSSTDAMPSMDAGGRIALPLFVDCHTHLDKGHILPRTTLANGSFPTALTQTKADREARWTRDDLALRMDFALRCALHYGTAAIRTHLDSHPPQDAISWPLFEELRQEWRGRIELQAASLVPIDFLHDEDLLARLARRVSGAGGVLGAVTYPTPDLDRLLDRLFQVASRQGMDLDFHADETADPAADTLHRIALAAKRNRFPGRVLVGHCCSLARQDSATVDATLDAVASAGIAVVSLPTCNLYLQDRRHDATTPRWRGVTLLHEMKKRGIPVALASDNTRDPFHAYGDLDMLETYRLATRVLHLDHPTADWPRAVSATPAEIMGLSGTGVIEPGGKADLILLEGRSWSEVLSRPESNRIVLRAGRPVDAPLPCYSELDALTAG
ncbi:cytosine deaminase [Nitratireductor pacificus]|nr:cytosine deaminase [Nitratireductor pacificus]